MEKYETLEKYAINLTDKAKTNKIDPIIGRDEEIRNVIRILSRKSKNNPVLIGDPGVGKTAIIEGLALRIVSRNVPKMLENKEIYSLDLGLLVAGAKFQGEFEERLKAVIEEVKNNQEKILLFIDEIHLLIGAGKTTGSMDAANLLKPELARGELNAIGATTLKEYRENIEKDPAFERRFQRVLVNEPTEKESLNILRGLKDTLEAYHGVRIFDEALQVAVNASSRYINDRFLPDKAIDLVDEAAANINVQVNSEPESMEKIAREITSLEIEKKALKGSKKNKEEYKEVEEKLKEFKQQYGSMNKQWLEQKDLIIKQKELKTSLTESKKELEMARNHLKYERAAELEYATIPELEEKLAKTNEKLTTEKIIRDEVTPKEIYTVVSKLTNIPVESLQEKTKEKLLHLEQRLNKRVIDQKEAIRLVTESIIRSRVNLSDPSKPIGSFLFLGPTGTGKTEVAKSLAFELFDDEHKMFRIDMSEFMEKHSISKLIGAPPGYVGYEAGGNLTEYIRRNPYSVILIDEIEKGHPDVLNILLQILDDGHVTDNQGNTVNFKNTIIIMTSNIASDIIIENQAITLKELEKELKGYLRPEFINRIDAIVKFNSITKDTYKKIVIKFLDELVTRVKEQEKELKYNDEIVEQVYENSYVPEFGARPVKRYIQNEIENKLALFLLENDSESITLNIKDNNIVIS